MSRFPQAVLLASLALSSSLLPAANEDKTKPLTDQEILADVKVPAEFDLTIFARPPLAFYPVYVAAAPDGTVYVSADKNGSLGRKPNYGSVLRVRDTNGDGVADESKAFVPNVDSPRGLVWDKDRLYLVHPPHLSVYIDKDGDGVSDEEKVLVKNLAFTFKDRPADHTTNGLSLGPDGWLYIAVGDFGFMEAEGTDGKKLQMRGGGILRVRPDGTNMEIFSHGTRNILEAGVSPELDLFTRDNTNDGGGWDMRLHHLTGGEDHGYPRLFKNFGDEIIQPIGNYGGGSGCGAMYLDEPGFPKGYSPAFYSADWGKNWIYRHELTPYGATFKDKQMETFGTTRATDLDVDAMSHVYFASWKGATFDYAGEHVGYLLRATPKGYKAPPLPDFTKLTPEELVKGLADASYRRRMEFQRELLRREAVEPMKMQIFAVANDGKLPLSARINAIFTLKQGLGSKSHPALAKLAADEAIRPYVMRALTDRADQTEEIPQALWQAGLKDQNACTRNQTVAGLMRLNAVQATPALAPLLDDSDATVAHTAFRAMASLHGHEPCFAIVDDMAAPALRRAGALRALSRMHTAPAVDGLLARLAKETGEGPRQQLITALCRLGMTEGVWKGDSWGTRPDTTGPYYQPEPWSETPRIEAALKALLARSAPAQAGFIIREMARHRIQGEGNLEQMLALAAQDENMIPMAFEQLGKAKSAPPPAALPLLLQAAAKPETKPDVRAQAIRVLALSDSAEAWTALPAALDTLRKQKSGKDFDPALKAYLESPKMENHHQSLEKAAAGKGPDSFWADAAVLTLAIRNVGAPEPKEQARKALEAGWKDAGRRVQILQVIAELNQKGYANKVLEALNDPDKTVADAARQTAKMLKLDASAQPKAGAPEMLIGKMKPEEVLAQVARLKGDPAQGAEVFTKVGCLACHTVKADEVQRGPYLGTIADTYKRPDLAENILLPNKTIAQGFVTNLFEMKDGAPQLGFVTLEAADTVTIRTIASQEFVLKTADIKKRDHLPQSLMPEGLMNNSTVQEFASLVDYLVSLAAKK